MSVDWIFYRKLLILKYLKPLDKYFFKTFGGFGILTVSQSLVLSSFLASVKIGFGFGVLIVVEVDVVVGGGTVVVMTVVSGFSVCKKKICN